MIFPIPVTHRMTPRSTKVLTWNKPQSRRFTITRHSSKDWIISAIKIFPVWSKRTQVHRQSNFLALKRNNRSQRDFGKSSEFQENELVLKSNLAIAYFLNSEPETAKELLVSIISALEKNKSSIMSVQSDNIKSLYLKAMANLLVINLVKNDLSECIFDSPNNFWHQKLGDNLSNKIFQFLVEIPINKREIFVQECIYI